MEKFEKYYLDIGQFGSPLVLELDVVGSSLAIQIIALYSYNQFGD